MHLYLGCDGLLILTPFTKRATKGCSPTGLPSNGERIADKADLAELIAEEPTPSLYNFDKKDNTHPIGA